VWGLCADASCTPKTTRHDVGARLRTMSYSLVAAPAIRSFWGNYNDTQPVDPFSERLIRPKCICEYSPRQIPIATPLVRRLISLCAIARQSPCSPSVRPRAPGTDRRTNGLRPQILTPPPPSGASNKGGVGFRHNCLYHNSTV